MTLKEAVKEYFITTPMPRIIEYSGIIWGVTGIIDKEPLPIIYGGMVYLLGGVLDRCLTALKSEPLAGNLEQKVNNNYQ